MKIRLVEEDQVFIYHDTATDKNYIFDGTSLQELKPNSGGGGGGNSPSIDIPGSKSDNKSDDKSGGKSKKKSGDKPGDKPDDKSGDKPGNKSGGKSGNKSPDKSDNTESPDEPGDPSIPQQPNPQNRPPGFGRDIPGTDIRYEGDRESVDIKDIDLNNILNSVDDLSDVWDDLSDKQKQTLRNKVDQVDKDVLAQEEEEREKQIEKELADLEKISPDSPDAVSKLEEIGDLLHDQSILNDLLDETERIVRQDRQIRAKEKRAAEEEAKRYEAHAGIDDFILDINNLIRSEINKITKSDWGKFNKKYEGSGIMKPGKTKKRNPVIPTLFVYYDASGSWGYNDIKIGDAAIATLNTYVQKKQLKIEVYYFGNYVSTNRHDHGGGTGAGNDIVKHIRTNRPDNVMIMTDADLYGDETLVSVPGGMFMLFRSGYVDEWLVRNFRGQKFTKVYKF